MPIDLKRAEKHLAVDRSEFNDKKQWNTVAGEAREIITGAMTVRELIEALMQVEDPNTPVVMEIVQKDVGDGQVQLSASYVMSVMEVTHETPEGEEIGRVHVGGCEPGALDAFHREYLELD